MGAELGRWFSGLDVNADYTEALVTLNDGSRLEFRHKVGERWAKAFGPDGSDHQAGRVLAATAMFRLNAKHLDVQFADGSRWEHPFRQRPVGTEPSR